MSVRPSRRLASLPGYAFAEVDRKVAELKAAGIRVLDFGVGDPQYPTPPPIRQACQAGVDAHAAAGYPSYVGSRRLRERVADWNRRRFGVTLDPDSEICSTIGAKEAVFHLPFALIDPGDVVLLPSPGYPPYRTGTLFAGGEVVHYGLDRANGFLPDLESLPKGILERARILWLNYPNSPTGRIAPAEFFPRAIEFCRRNDIVLASDEAYTEIWFTERPRSFLEFGREGILVFQSMSKRSAMTGYRIGWVCGDSRLVTLFKKLKTNIDSGVPDFVQDAAVAALGDESHVEDARMAYQAKRDMLIQAMRSLGLSVEPPEGTIYIWQQVPDGTDDVEFATRLLAPGIAIAVVPGSWIARPLADGTNPGKGYVRWALCPPIEEVEEACRRLGAARF
ncbi:MAG: aminotransferase class I/II-fold pyridoxal phosphate-dependent enzyme [Deltaproteobacteria bacterium]|nr:aminotransferase class I/II-fold pyridoxal phosphate-dependent enzyme [Deltaproteobacteria bacterium]